MKRTWNVLGEASPIVELDALRQQLCAIRNIENEHIFFSPTYSETVHNPYELEGMQAAVERIEFAVKKQERIVVWGDYDADGVSATAVLVEALHAVGAHVVPYLPHRHDEGYGLSLNTLKALEPELDLLITVDCGISNTKEVDFLRKKKKDVIVTDHHEIPKQLPKALAILHPRHPKGSYPWGQLAGSGVAWKLAQALLRHESLGKRSPDEEKWLLDLPLLGTLADVMPLQGENRAIVRFGLEVLRRSRRPGLLALMELARLDKAIVSARDVAFRIIPAINAAGRMDHPQAALDVLLAKDMVSARKKAAALVELNNERRVLSGRILKEAQAKVDPTLPIVFAFDSAWAPGVVGIVAGKLAEQHGKPALVIGGNGAHAVGSARSAGNIDIHAVLQQAAKHTIKMGGHKQAAGFSLKETSAMDFRDAVVEAMNTTISDSIQTSLVQADAVIDKSLLKWDTQALVQSFEPFGEANEAPRFIVRDVPVVHATTVGKDDSHLKLKIHTGAADIEAIGFGLAKTMRRIPKAVDIVGNLSINTFRGSASLQFTLDDVVSAGSVTIKR